MYVWKIQFQEWSKKHFGMIPIDLGQPEGMLGDEGEKNDKGDGSV